jgi:hypothetical protein
VADGRDLSGAAQPNAIPAANPRKIASDNARPSRRVRIVITLAAALPERNSTPAFGDPLVMCPRVRIGHGIGNRHRPFNPVSTALQPSSGNLDVGPHGSHNREEQQ